MDSFWLRFPKILRQLRRVDALKFTNDSGDYPDHERLMISGRLVFVEGGGYRNYPLARKYRDFYRRTLSEAKPPVDANSVLASEKINLAVHIRRGDYATWLGGKYFYSDDVYLSAIEQALTLVGTKSRILVFTNDPFPDRAPYQAAFGDVAFPGSDPNVDHYLMSLCDYIIGPPSTFSMWASYIGKAKYRHIYYPNEIIDKDSFGICEG